MYVRFVTPLRDPATGAETGFFRASWYLDRVGCPDWINNELEDQFTWFNRNLRVPRQLTRPSRSQRRRTDLTGVCWFRPEALECIDRARYCAWLITEGGVPVAKITLGRPRIVIWEDDHQLVIPPQDDTPQAFPGRRFVERDSDLM